MSDIRSALFVPASLPARVEKAIESKADTVLVDLEDGVPESGKVEAREIAAAALIHDRGRQVALRLNGTTTSHFEEDLRVAGELSIDAIVVPKADAAALHAVDGSDLRIWALVETATGLRDAYEVAEHPLVDRLILGTVDLASDLGLEARADGLELLYARSLVVTASRAARIAAALDGVCLKARDQQAVRAEADLARSLGFGGKTAIHPDQIEPIHASFAPDAAALEWARRVVAASEEAETRGLGAVVVDGAMVDLPVVKQAHRLLSAAIQEEQ
jgi:citrate lyase beta subunit